jgi:polyisoprenoid-binding protein YceI
VGDTSVTSIDQLEPGTYRLDPARSTISYSGRHMFGLGRVAATFTVRSGQLQVADGLAGSTADITIDAASFTSNSEKRDRDVTSATFLDVDTYPTIRFESQGMYRQAGSWVLPGNVNAHGISVPVHVLIDRLGHDDTGVRISAHAPHLDRYAWNVVKGKGMVGRYLDLHLDVVCVAA